MRKVLVVGSGGAGKSTFARRLGQLLNLEVIHLDSLYWNSGWVETPKAEWAKTVEELTRRDSWVMDGNYSGTLDIRIKACDTLIFLDMPRRVCFGRVLKRLIAYRHRTRPDMAAGCNEKLSWEFILWVWNYPKTQRPNILDLMRQNAGHKKMIRLRSPAETERFLATVVNA
ncbi:MAG TPA: DNA topology modulation protein [Pyrinomonadaceae bacterium]|nr:DNA topology modulation protein [Pyrinomonadaceae bacterium]